jgi:hypothetical protein
MARVDARASFPASAATPGSVGPAQRGRQLRPGIGRFSRHGTADRRAAFARGAHGERYERLGHTVDERVTASPSVEPAQLITASGAADARVFASPSVRAVARYSALARS